jgi:hydrogenase nickel incorporation protein HypB
MEVLIMKKLLAANDDVAAKNREYFAQHSLYVINLMGAPGSGKTTLISAVAKRVGVPVGVIEGDISSSIDAERLNGEGVKSVQINTCGECHLDAQVIREGAQQLGMDNAVVFVENVGNLICPAEFDLGEDLRLLAASVPEGDDKPFKYVPMFSYIDLVALTKCDLKKAVGFDGGNFRKGLGLVSKAEIIEVGDKGASGADKVAEFIKERFIGKTGKR